MSALCSIALVVLLAPWPDFVSMRIRIGLLPPCAACNAAAYLKLENHPRLWKEFIYESQHCIDSSAL